MKTPLGTEVDLGRGHIVLDGVPALRERGTAPPPLFPPMSIVATVAGVSYCLAVVHPYLQQRTLVYTKNRICKGLQIGVT